VAMTIDIVYNLILCALCQNNVSRIISRYLSKYIVHCKFMKMYIEKIP